MKRPHRAVHRLMWPVLAFAVVLGFTLALVWRPPIPIETGSGPGSGQ
jgi:hypothetical protein